MSCFLAAGNGASVRVRGFAGGLAGVFVGRLADRLDQDRVRLAVLKIDLAGADRHFVPDPIIEVCVDVADQIADARCVERKPHAAFKRHHEFLAVFPVFLGDEFDPLVQRRPAF